MFSILINNRIFNSSDCWNRTSFGRTAEEFRNKPCINWYTIKLSIKFIFFNVKYLMYLKRDAIFYIRIPREVWIAQVFLAVLSYTQTILISYLTFKVTRNQLIDIYQRQTNLKILFQKGNLLQTLSQLSFLLDTLTSFSLIMTVCDINLSQL